MIRGLKRRCGARMGSAQPRLQANMVKPGLDYRRAYTLEVVREVKVLP
jgi:hypothetical protein